MGARLRKNGRDTLITGKFFKRVPLPGGEQLPLGWFAISYRFVKDSNQRRRTRNHWYQLTVNSRSIYRVLRFAANMEAGHDENPAGLSVDYQGWWELQGLTVPEEPQLCLDIRRANILGKIVANCRHPDPTHRFASWLAVIALALGIVSIALAI